MRRTTGLGMILATLLFSLGAAISANAFIGQTARVSVSSTGDPANVAAANGVLSADGRYVVFPSSATNLVAGANGLQQIYRHDRANGETVMVSVSTTGSAGNSVSRDPSVSANGRYVVFSSFATDLVAGDTNGLGDVFVRDMQSGVTTLASTGGLPADASSALSGLTGAREISDDGRYVVFLSRATNLVPEANNGAQQVYLKDMTTGAVARVSVATTGEAGDLNSTTPAISGNGLFVAFGSLARNFSPLSTVGTASQVFVRDLAAGTTTLESAGTAAVNKPSTVPVLSADGRYLAFVAEAPLSPLDLDNGTADVYLRDRVAGTTVLASLSPETRGGGVSGSPSISGDGRWVAFSSIDELMVSPDTNGTASDVFIYDRDHPSVTIVSRNDAGDQAASTFPGTSLSADAHFVLFSSMASNLVTTPPSTVAQLYVRNLVSNQAPVIPAFGKDFVVSESQSLHLTWEFSDNDGSTSWTATVDYGDGSGSQSLALNANKTFVLDHLYMPGTYDLTVAVTDDARATGSLVIHVVDSNVAPTVGLLSTLDLAFSRTLDTGGTFTDPGSNETYAATVNYGDGSGDQALAIGPYDASPLVGGSFVLHHTYARPGTYNVVVTVGDGRGGSTSATMVVKVGGFSYEWLDPLGSEFVVGRNLPVKFTVLDRYGSFVFDRTVSVDVIDDTGNVMAGPYLFGDQPSRAVTVSSDSYHVNVDTRDLAPGMYWLRVQFSSARLTGEFSMGTTGTAGATTSITRSRTLR